MVSAAIALYLNVFVGVTQAFLKIPALTALAPTQAEPPFAIVQLAVLALVIALTVVAVKKGVSQPFREPLPSLWTRATAASAVRTRKAIVSTR